MFLAVPDAVCLITPNPTQHAFFFFHTSQLLLLTYVTDWGPEAQSRVVTCVMNVETRKWQLQGHVPCPGVLPTNYKDNIQLLCNEKLGIHSTNDLTLKIKAIGNWVPGTMKHPIW